MSLAMRMIATAIRAQLDGAEQQQSRRIVARVQTAQLAGTSVAPHDLTAREIDILQQLTAGKSILSLANSQALAINTVLPPANHL